ncbi:MAG: two-component sensor histidine kinase [Actinobacteria bacterium]|nr:MAG: two-component sensor histidine kinase [Actinomycetota bacterium]
MRRRAVHHEEPARPVGYPPEPVDPEPDLPPQVRRAGAKGLGRRSLDALRVGVMVLDAEDRPVLVNPAAKEMGLLRAGTAVGGTPVAHTVVRTLAGQARRTGTRREVELDLPRGNGRDPLGVHIRAVALGDGHVTIEAADVTEAHRVARVRRDFVANVSHELKTPVGAVQLLAEALLDATAEAAGSTPDELHEADVLHDLAAARRFAERIQHESTRLGRLVSELLDLARLQGGEPLPEPAPVSVDRIIAEVIDRTRTPASAKGLEVRFVSRRGLTVYGSESQLVAAVANLVENAVAYSPDAEEGKPPPRVTITAKGDADWVEIAVRDQGIGIEPKDLDRIFERFYRADRARSRATGGTGLGLAIVKHIATNHGGQVEVASTVGVGSTFTLRLPARPPDAALPLPLSIEIAAESAGVKGSA